MNTSFHGSQGLRRTQEIQDKVCVAVRVRPLSQKEFRENGASIVSIAASQISLEIEKQTPVKYNFDHVFQPDSSQSLVFEALGLGLLDRAFEGYNFTIFAYGQTGSGKTFTMLNHEEREHWGIVPRLTEALFSQITKVQSKLPHRQFLVQCSFLEIYNEILYDLLVPSRSRAATGLEIKEQKGLGVYVKDLKEIVVDSSEKLLGLIEQGFLQRATAATKMNQTSSRSHCIITVKLHQRDEQSAGNNTVSTMSLVDLAGSERAKDTGAEGALLKEGANINKSLSALGNVINALSSQAGGQKKVFVPYRNSKLTRVLQDCLGGNSFCTMLANVSPASVNAEETLSTLNYAKRAKLIHVKATKNEEGAQLAKLEDEVEHLREKLQEQTTQAQVEMDIAEQKELEEKYNVQIEELRSVIAQTWQDKQHISVQHEADMSRLKEEARLREEQLLSQRQRKLELIEEKADLSLSLREVQTLDAELCSSWVGKVAHAQAIEPRLRAQVHAVQLCRESVKQDLGLWWEVWDKPDAALRLNQVAAKLTGMCRELSMLVDLERDIWEQLTKVLPEAERALSCCEEGEEATGIMKLVVRQLAAYRLHVQRFLYDARSELVLDEELPRLREALGQEDLVVSPFQEFSEALPIPLGLSSHTLSNTSITASSNENAAFCARLLYDEGPFGGWCANDELGHYIEVDLERNYYIAAIATQGRVPATGGWQQTRELLRQALNGDLLLSGEPLPPSDRVYMRPPVRFIHDIATTFIERFRILPDVFTKEQFDFAKLASKDLKTTFFDTLISQVQSIVQKESLEVVAADILAGKNTLGTGKLLQLLAYLVLRKSAGNEALFDVRNQWTTRFTLEYSSKSPPTNWSPVSVCGIAEKTLFDGNSDETSIKLTSFPAFYARHIRIRPVEWHNHPALRIEIYGSDELPCRVCGSLEQRLQQFGEAVSALKQQAEERGRVARQVDEEERSKKAAQAAQVEQEHAEMGKKLEAAQKDLEELQELRRWKKQAEEKMIEAEAARLQMHVEVNRAEALAKQLGEDLSRETEARQANEQLLVDLRQETESFRETVGDMSEQIQVLTDERDAAQLREEEIFEQMLAMEETLVDTTEGYLTEKLKEQETEVDHLQKRLSDEEKKRKAYRRLFVALKEQAGDSAPIKEGLRLSSALYRGENEVYEDDFDDENSRTGTPSSYATPRRTPRKGRGKPSIELDSALSSTLTSVASATPKAYSLTMIMWEFLF